MLTSEINGVLNICAFKVVADADAEASRLKATTSKSNSKKTNVTAPTECAKRGRRPFLYILIAGKSGALLLNPKYCRCA